MVRIHPPAPQIMKTKTLRDMATLSKQLDKEKYKNGEHVIMSGKEKPTIRRDRTVNTIDDKMAFVIDHKETLHKYARQISRLSKTNDVHSFFQDIAPSIAVELLALASNASDKVSAQILQDFLDRGGYTKVTKHAVARFDAKDSKDAIISSIMGAKKELSKMGIEIEDEGNEETTGEPSEG